MSYLNKNKIRQALPSEKNVIEYVNEYFEIFETNLKNGNYSTMNTRLPRLIAVKFKKLFELWDENRILGASMEKKIFEDVYSSMRNTNNFCDLNETGGVSSADNFFLECKHCGDEFPLRNNDCTYSYESHEATSATHMKLVNFFNSENIIPVSNEDQSRNCNGTNTDVALLKRDSGKDDHFVECLEPLQEHSNHLLEVVSESITVTVNDTTNSQNFSYSVTKLVRESDKNCIVVEKNSIRCKSCFSLLRSVQNFFTHMNGARHKKEMQRFALNRGYVTEKDNQFWLCTICETSHKNLSDCLYHCKNPDHTTKLNKLLRQSSSSSLSMRNERMVDMSISEFKCPVCDALLCGADSLFKHLKKLHKAK